MIETLLRNQQLRAEHESTGQLLGYVVAESFFSSLKKERIRKRLYTTRDMARADLSDYIEIFYSRASVTVT